MLCLYFGSGDECQLCGGWVHSIDPETGQPEVPEGEPPIAGKFCSTLCYDEAVTKGWVKA